MHNKIATDARGKLRVRAVDPASPLDGDIWYNSTTDKIKARVNGATIELGAGGAVAEMPYQISASGGRQPLQRYTSGGSNGSLVGQIRLSPIVLPIRTTLSALECSITSGTAAGLGKFSVYASRSDGYPGTLMLETADFVASSGVKSASAPVTFEAWVQYWIGIRFDSVVTVATAIGCPTIAGALAFNAAQQACLARGTTYATPLPNDWGFVASEIATNREPFIIQGVVA